MTDKICGKIRKKFWCFVSYRIINGGDSGFNSPVVSAFYYEFNFLVVKLFGLETSCTMTWDDVSLLTSARELQLNNAMHLKKNIPVLMPEFCLLRNKCI